MRGNNVEKFECLTLLIKNNNGGNNWEKIKTLLSSYSAHSLAQSDQTSQVSYHNNFITYLFCDKTFKSTFQLNPVSNSTRHSMALSEQIENKKLLNNMSVKKDKNDKFIFPNKDNDVDYSQFTDKR